MKSVVVLGGYGNFGRRIVAALAREQNCRVFVCGRDAQKAKQIADQEAGSAEPLALDCHAPDFSDSLLRIAPSLVVHTAGPFQGQTYAVPRACIAARAHYIDLADGHAYVCGIRALDQEARHSDVLVASGASSLPALSSAVVDRLRTGFSRIESIDHGITSGARPPGRATMEGVLAYAGKRLTQWSNGEWHTEYGWQGIARQHYPSPVNARWIAHCDVPDLELFPERYAPVNTVRFRGGVGPEMSMFGLWLASWLVRLRVLPSLEHFVPILHHVASGFAPIGSKCSAMHVTVRGRDGTGNPACRTWYLLAGRDHGPHIPTFPAIALARKLLRGEVLARGAMPCMGLLTVSDILSVGDGLDLRVVER